MTIRLPLAVLVLASLSACAVTQSDPVRLDENTYSIKANSGLRGISWVELKLRLLEQARQHCESSGLKLVKPELTSNKATGLIPKAVTLRFQCLPNDNNGNTLLP